MKKQVVVIGLGRLGVAIAATLNSLGHDVLAVDTDETSVQNAATEMTRAVQADATNESVLKELGVGNFDIGIVTLSDIGSNVLATVLLKKLGVAYTIARAQSELHGAILEKVGADKVVHPEREMGTMIAHVLTLGNVIDYIPVTGEYGVMKLLAPASFEGQTLTELGFGRGGKWKVAVLLMLRKNQVIVTPELAEKIEPGDTLVVAGTSDSLEHLMGRDNR